MESARENKVHRSYIIRFYNSDGAIEYSTFHSWLPNAEAKALQRIAYLTAFAGFISLEIIEHEG